MSANPFTAAVRQADAHRRVLAAKGFKASGSLEFIRRDARLQFDSKSALWVVDLYNVSDAANPEIATRRSHSDLGKLIKGFI